MLNLTNKEIIFKIAILLNFYNIYENPLSYTIYCGSYSQNDKGMFHTYNQTWRGTYQSFQYDITTFERIPKVDLSSYGFKENWAYYIYLHEDNLPKDIRMEFLNIETDEKYGYFQYSNLSLIHDLEFHGGVTFFDIIYARLNKKVFKIGCDYQHLWDEGRHYSKEYLQNDANNTINKLEEICPNLKYRCSWDGKYYPKEQGIFIKNGEFTIQKEKYKNS